MSKEILGDAVIWGWRNIGREFGVSERTARTYGKELGLPHFYSCSGYVWTFPHMLKQWLFLCGLVRRAIKANKINCAGLGCFKFLSIEDLADALSQL